MSYHTEKTFYVSKEELTKAIDLWQHECRLAAENNHSEPVMPDIIGQAILDIAEKLSHRYNWRSYTYRDEMVSDAILASVIAIRKFDSGRTRNPFGFLTRVVWRAFVARVVKERLINSTKHNLSLDASSENNFCTNEFQRGDFDSLGGEQKAEFEEFLYD